MKKAIGWLAALAFAPSALAADLEAGRAKVATVCAACHGATGVSVSDAIPNLGAQRARYIEAQLKALKDGTRKNSLMNAIASQLSAADIVNVAAYFAAQPGAAAGARSALLPNLAKSRVVFPDGYRDHFTKYHMLNFPETRQVRRYFANPVAIEAAKQGKPLPDGAVLLVEVHAARLDADQKPVTGADGFYEAEKPLFFTAMARGAGWGSEIPELLRNGDWNYALFSLDRQALPGVNQAECLACHKPLDKESYLFTLKQLAAAK